MKPRTRKIMLVLLALLLSLPFAAYWFAGYWLESSGGRAMLERELSRRIGMSVRLEGNFNLMLLPNIGVSGTGLLVGGERDSPTVFSVFRKYEISVALKPLFHNEIIVEWIRLTGGRVFPDRYLPAEQNETAGPAVVPEVQELTLSDFEIVLPGHDMEPLRLNSLNISGFAEGRETPFSLEIEALVVAKGSLLLDTGRSGIWFDQLTLEAGGQALGGGGCLILSDPWVLQIDLQAGSLDADALMETLPETGSAGDGGNLPLEIRARLRVDELRSGDVVAHGVELAMGESPACD